MEDRKKRRNKGSRSKCDEKAWVKSGKKRRETMWIWRN
jgi:hypothetical protein